MASSADYADSKFNLAAQGERQPGSSFKVFALMTALRNGVNPNSTRYTSVSPTVFDDPKYGAPSTSRPTAAQRRQHEPVPGDAALGQLGLHPARARPRARQGRRDGGRHGHPPPCARLSGRVARRPRERRLAARDGDRVRDDRVRRVPQPADRDHQGHVRGPAPLRAAAPLAPAPHEGLPRRRDLRGDQDPGGEHPGRHRYAREHRLPGRRQDRHDRQQHRRMVRRLHAAARRQPCGSATPTSAST